MMLLDFIPIQSLESALFLPRFGRTLVSAAGHQSCCDDYCDYHSHSVAVRGDAAKQSLLDEQLPNAVPHEEVSDRVDQPTGKPARFVESLQFQRRLLSRLGAGGAPTTRGKAAVVATISLTSAQHKLRRDPSQTALERGVLARNLTGVCSCRPAPPRRWQLGS